MRTIILAAFLLFSCARESVEIGGGPVADLDAQELLARTIQRYENASHYRDSGTIRTRIKGHEFTYAFTTEFTGPSKLDLVLKRNGEERYAIRLDQQPAEQRDNALAGGTGVTSGTSTTVPPLLLDSTVPSTLSRMSNAEIRGTEEIHGERCTRVEGTDHKGNRFVVWIGEDTQVLRRSLRTLTNGVPQEIENQLDYETVSFSIAQ